MINKSHNTCRKIFVDKKYKTEINEIMFFTHKFLNTYFAYCRFCLVDLIIETYMISLNIRFELLGKSLKSNVLRNKTEATYKQPFSVHF